MKRLIILGLIVAPLTILAIHRLRDTRHHRVEFAPSFLPPVPPLPPMPPMPPMSPLPPTLIEHHDEPQGPNRVVRRVIVRAGAKLDRHRHAGHPDTVSGIATCCFEADPTEAEPGLVRVSGELMADEPRALKDLQQAVERRVADWLADAGLPSDWQAPEPLVTALVHGEPQFEAEEREYGIDGLMHRASVEVDLSRANKMRLMGEYHRQTSARRIGQLGGGLAFILATLAVYAGYVRSDEATKGYYTNRLRLIAAAAVGAAGVVLYQMVA